MRRVYVMYAWRTVAAPAPRAAIFITLMLTLFGSISFVDVISNVMTVSTLDGLLNFGYSAFANTSNIVYTLGIAVLGSGLWFVSEQTKEARLREVSLEAPI